jgi:hypothetical protein
MILVARPLVDDEEKVAIHRVLASGQLAQGEYDTHGYRHVYHQYTIPVPDPSDRKEATCGTGRRAPFLIHCSE